MLRIFLFTIFMAPALCFSQYNTFQQVLNFNSSATEGDVIISTSDGGYALAGVVNIGGNTESFLAKYNSSGENEWTRIYYDEQSQVSNIGVNDTEIFCNQYVRFLLAFDDGFVLGGGIDTSVAITYSNGVTVGSDYSRMFALHTDAAGNLLWSKKFIANDNTFGEDAISTADGSLLLTGSVTQPGLVLRDIGLWKLNSDGDIEWARSYGGSLDEGIAHLIEASPSQWILCGVSESFSNQNIYLINIDTVGQLNWSKIYGSPGFDYGKGIVKAADGGYYVFGNAGNSNPSYIALMKIDSVGVLQWTKTYGEYPFDSPQDLLATPDGNLVMLVTHYTGEYDGLACEVDAGGNYIDARIFGNSGSNQNDFIHSMIPEQGGYTFTGVTNSFSGNQVNQVYLIRTHDGLRSDCFSDTVGYYPASLTLTASNVSTAISVLDATGYQMNVVLLDSTLLADTLCFSVATSVTAPASFAPVYVFPNPADDDLLIRSSVPLKQVTCLNQVGETIFSEAGKNVLQMHIQTSDLPEGIYFLRAETEKRIFYQKIIVAH